MNGEATRQRPEEFGIGQLFWRMADAVVAADATSGRIVLWNPAAEALFGYTADEALTLTVDALVPVPLSARHVEGRLQYAELGHGPLIDSGAGLELPAVRKNGEKLFIELTLSRLESVALPGRFVVAMIRDVTERKRAEEGRERLYREAEALAELNQQITINFDLSQVLQQAVEAAQRLIGVERAYLALRESDGGVRVAARAGAGDPVGSQLRVAAGRGISGRILATGHPYQTDDYLGDRSIRHDPAADSLVRDFMTRSLLGVPIKRGPESIGVFWMASSTPRRFTPAEVSLLERIAGQAAVAIENARVLGREQAARAEAEALTEVGRRLLASLDLAAVLQTLVDAAQRLVRADLAQAGVPERAGGVKLVAFAGQRTDAFRGLIIPPGTVVAGPLLQTGGPDRVADFLADRAFRQDPALAQAAAAEGIVSLLAVPIRRAARALGVLLVGSRTPRAFTADEEALLERLAVQAALAMENARANERLAALATHDELTGLANRRAFNQRLTQMLAQARRHRQDLSLLMADIDHFKAVNDSAGHQAGDRVLRVVAQTIESQIRVDDIAARYGGEEFAVLLPQTSDIDAEDAAERIRQAVEQTRFDFPTGQQAVTISIGIAAFAGCGDDAAGLIGHADAALYEAKQSGRNRVRRCRVPRADARGPTGAESDAGKRGDATPDAATRD